MRTGIMAAAVVLTSVATSAHAITIPGSAGLATVVQEMDPVEKAQVFVYSGRRYCFYIDGWHGPGWYRCGFAWRRGLGWGGVYGWNEWRHPHYHVRFGRDRGDRREGRQEMRRDRREGRQDLRMQRREGRQDLQQRRREGRQELRQDRRDGRQQLRQEGVQQRQISPSGGGQRGTMGAGPRDGGGRGGTQGGPRRGGGANVNPGAAGGGGGGGGPVGSPGGGGGAGGGANR